MTILTAAHTNPHQIYSSIE